MLLCRLDEVGQLLYEVGQQVFADSHQGGVAVATRVDLWLGSIRAFDLQSLQPALIL